MKAKLPIMIQDPITAPEELEKLYESFVPSNEEFFLDGPVTKRVAVIDFSPKTGEIEEKAIFKQAKPGISYGWYEDGKGKTLLKTKEKEVYKPTFMQTSVLAAVLKTLYLFEGADYASFMHQTYKERVENTYNHTLGRSLNWAFDSPQLLIIPRSGEWANAFYHRDSHSLQFFYFTSPKDSTKKVFTCLSRDIVAHETAHAIIDCIAPDLSDASTPQSLAIHEALADLTALLSALDSYNLGKIIYNNMELYLEKPSLFSFIAEEFGNALKGTRGLRNLNNEKNLNPHRDENTVDSSEPHALSEVLSGVLYKIMIYTYNNLQEERKKKPVSKNKEKKKTIHPAYTEEGRDLWRAAKRIKRMVFRALDYLPPGEVSFQDYGRAMIAVDQVAYPKDEKMRKWVTKEFLKRHIIENENELEVKIDDKNSKIEDYDVKTLLKSDWAAYDFANKNRDLLKIPEREPLIQFQVKQRLYLDKRYDYNHPRSGKECLFKVAWNDIEENDIGIRYPKRRAITVGTTLAVDWKTNEILAILTTSPSERTKKEYKKQKNNRDKFLINLAENELLKIGNQGLDSGGRPLLMAIQTEIIGDIMHIKGTGKLLHIIGR